MANNGAAITSSVVVLALLAMRILHTIMTLTGVSITCADIQRISGHWLLKRTCDSQKFVTSDRSAHIIDAREERIKNKRKDSTFLMIALFLPWGRLRSLVAFSCTPPLKRI